MEWDFDKLFAKAKLFSQRAHELDRDDTLFPLWCTFGLEMLARAVLARVHPALLADPADTDSLLHVFGIAQEGIPKSLGVKQVFQRCCRLVKEFTAKDIEIATALMERRNQELHSGVAAFDGFGTEKWLYDYYRICQILLRSIDADLTVFFGTEEGKSAAEMIQIEVQKVADTVRSTVRLHKEDFYRKDEQERAALWAQAKATPVGVSAVGSRRKEKCPACGGQAVISGHVVRVSSPKLLDTDITRQVVMLPIGLECDACGLKLNGHEKLHAVGLGGQFSYDTYDDPVEYFCLDMPPIQSNQEYMDE